MMLQLTGVKLDTMFGGRALEMTRFIYIIQH
jgi:hypothetical protein